MTVVSPGDVFVDQAGTTPSFYVVDEVSGMVAVFYETYRWVVRNDGGRATFAPNMSCHRGERLMAVLTRTSRGVTAEVSRPRPITLVPWDGRPVTARARRDR